MRNGIPMDIMETAHELAFEWAMPETEDACRAAIAQALLAQREECIRRARNCYLRLSKDEVIIRDILDDRVQNAIRKDFFPKEKTRERTQL